MNILSPLLPCPPFELVVSVLGPNPIELVYAIAEPADVYNYDAEIHAGEDQAMVADYNACVESAPDLSGSRFVFVLTPKDGTGAIIRKNTTIIGTQIAWNLQRLDTVSREGEVFTGQLRRTNSGRNRVIAELDVKIVF